MPLAGEVVLPVGIEHREGRGQLLVGLVMVDDDDFGPARLAASMATPAVVPQSTVMMSVAPSSASPAMDAGVGP